MPLREVVGPSVPRTVYWPSTIDPVSNPAPDYLACTKPPPRDLPFTGLASCLAPRNHDGPCEFGAGDGARVIIRQGPPPEVLIAWANDYHRKARRAYKTSMVSSLVSAVCAGWLLMDAIRSVTG